MKSYKDFKFFAKRKTADGRIKDSSAAPSGKYTLREETAPSGYLVAEDVEFEVKDTGEIQTVTMKDAQENPEQPGTPMPETPKTGDMNNPLLWGGIGVIALLGLMTTVARRFKSKI